MDSETALAVPRDALPLGVARLVRPSSIRRLRFEDFLKRPRSKRNSTVQAGEPPGIVPIEAVASGDTQVFAARKPDKGNAPVIDLGVLADFPSVESIVASTHIRTAHELPAIREVIMCGLELGLNTATLKKLTGVESLYVPHLVRDTPLDLDCLPAESMQQLAIWRWDVQTLSPLSRMTALRQLDVTLFQESLAELVSKMHGLTFLRALGPAKAWLPSGNARSLKRRHSPTCRWPT
jgi:hypothetical protein